MLNNLFRTKPKAQDVWEARGVIEKYGDGAQDRMIARAESCSPGSRDRAHWQRLSKVVGQMLDERAEADAQSN